MVYFGREEFGGRKRHMVLGSSYGANGTAFSHGEVRVAAPHFYLKAGLICLITPSHDIAQDC